METSFTKSLATCYAKLGDSMKQLLQQSAYSQVDLSQLFQTFVRIKKEPC